jgi:hypothetical protein
MIPLTPTVVGDFTLYANRPGFGQQRTFELPLIKSCKRSIADRRCQGIIHRERSMDLFDVSHP